MRSLAIAFVVVLLLSPAAVSAEPFTSSEFGFSADFPVTPQQKPPVDSERDENGNVVSRIVMFQAGVRGVYAASVNIDTHFVPRHVNAPATLATGRDSFLGAMSASATRTETLQIKGHPAMRFSYETSDHSARGRGLVIVIESEMPRIYMVVTAGRYPQVGADTDAALERFFNSFRLTD